MGTFQDDLDKRLRRVCGVTDDTLRVEQSTETIGGGYCETCWWEDEVIRVSVYGVDGKVVAEQDFDELGELMRAVDEVEL